MAPKTPSRSRQPTSEKQEKHEQADSESESPSFSDEEEEEEEEEEKEDFSGETGVGSSEEDQDLQRLKKSNSNKQNGSDSDDESDPGSPSHYKLQPISTLIKSSSKRANQEKNPPRMSKRAKTDQGKKKSPSSPAAPGGCIDRLWSDEDEVIVLNGMIEFKNAKGRDPNADMGAFYDFVKGKLQIDFSKEQLRTKIRRMKKRFLNALGKGDNGVGPVFSKPHEDKAFELSKKIWGGGNEVSEDAKKDVVMEDVNGVVKKEGDGEGGNFWSQYPFLSASFGNMGLNFPSLGMSASTMSFAKENLSSMGSVKAKELDDKWKQLTMEEVEVSHKMLNLMKEQMKMAFGK